MKHSHRVRRNAAACGSRCNAIERVFNISICVRLQPDMDLTRLIHRDRPQPHDILQPDNAQVALTLVYSRHSDGRADHLERAHGRQHGASSHDVITQKELLATESGRIALLFDVSRVGLQLWMQRWSRASRRFHGICLHTRVRAFARAHPIAICCKRIGRQSHVPRRVPAIQRSPVGLIALAVQVCSCRQ